MDDFQRDGPDSPEQWRATADEFRGEVAAADGPEERARAQGRLGDHLRLRSDTADEAVDVLDEAVDLAESADAPGLLVSNLIRYATALQYAGHHDRARPVFERAIRRADRLPTPVLEGFARQHFGKCLVELGDHTGARRQLQRALAIRRDRGDEDLIDSTERALAGLDERTSNT